MRDLSRHFTAHPASVGETYGQHFRSATSFSRTMAVAAFCCGIHAVFPFIFEKAASRAVEQLFNDMCLNRSWIRGGDKVAVSLKAHHKLMQSGPKE